MDLTNEHHVANYILVELNKGVNLFEIKKILYNAGVREKILQKALKIALKEIKKDELISQDEIIYKKSSLPEKFWFLIIFGILLIISFLLYIVIKNYY
jgi:hypothetical protein